MKKIILDFAGGTTKEVKCSDEVYDRIVKIIKGEQGFGFNKPVRKKRKFVGMTNEEYISKHFIVSNTGKMPCPKRVGMQNCYEPFYSDYCRGRICADTKTPMCCMCLEKYAKRNGKWIVKEVKDNEM